MDQESKAFAQKFATIWVEHYNEYWESKLSRKELDRRIGNCAEYMRGVIGNVLDPLSKRDEGGAQNFLNYEWESMAFSHVLDREFDDFVEDDPDEKYVNDERYHETSNRIEDLWLEWLAHINKKHKCALKYNPDGGNY